MNPPILTALCAYGMSGTVFHAPLLDTHPGFLIKKILERSPKGASDKYPYAEIVHSVEEILNDSTIELVVVNTPESTHYSLVKQVLLAGKNVVVEKAFTTTLAEAEELAALAHKQKKMLTVFQNRRWDGDFLTLKSVVKNGMVGRVVALESHFNRYRNYIQEGTWKEAAGPGRGILYNLGSHLIDQTIVLFGMPRSVFADIRIQRTDGEVPDSFELMLDYPEVRVRLHASYLVREPMPRFILNGTLGSFVKYGLDPQEAALKSGLLPDSPGWGTEPESEWGTLNTEWNGLSVKGKIETLPGDYLAFYTSVYEALHHAHQPPVSLDEAIGVMRIIEAAQSSHEQGWRVNL